MKLSQIIATIICLSLILITAGCTDSTNTPSEQPTPTHAQDTYTPSGQNLTVHFLDVGQGDSILIEYDNKDMLIDAGESDREEVVTDYLKNQGISALYYVVATHPHSDHIGGMEDVLNQLSTAAFSQNFC